MAKFLKMLALGAFISLTGCATHGAGLKSICDDGFACAASQKAVSAGYLYTPPSIYRTWINSHLTTGGEVVGPHFRYWVGQKGQWNLPLRTQEGVASDVTSVRGAF